MSKVHIFRFLAFILSLLFFIGGIFLLTPNFDEFINKVNGVVFIGLAVSMAVYAWKGNHK